MIEDYSGFSFGIVEDRDDPHKLGRCRVRIVGLHTEDKTVLPTEKLPWATRLVTGFDSPPSIKPGSKVAILFQDAAKQQPVIFGVVHSIPQSQASQASIKGTDNIFSNGGMLVNSFGQQIQNLVGDVVTLDQTINATISAVTNADDVILAEFNNIVDTAKSAANQCLQEIQNELSNMAQAAVNAAIKEAGSLFSGAIAGFPDISAITGEFEKAIKLIGGIKDEITGAINGIVATEKSIANAIGSVSCGTMANFATSQVIGMLEDRSSNKTRGFCDPNGKYPLRYEMDEQSTHRLFRGVTKGTVLEYTDLDRKEVPQALSTKTWTLPKIQYGGEPPYCGIYETESGSVTIDDNTPGFESKTFVHRSGTYDSIDSKGSKINKISGDGYTIVDRNGYITIEGLCHLTVGNSVNVLVQGAANIQIYGPANATFHNDVNLAVAKNVNAKIAKDINLSCEGNFNIKCDGEFNVESKKDLTLKTTKKLMTESGMDTSILANGNILVDGIQFRGQEKLTTPVTKLATFVSTIPKPSESQGAKDKWPNQLEIKRRKE